MDHKGFTLWLTGMSGAGKSTISDQLMARFREAGAKVELLDGDIVRTNLSQGLGFSREDRDINIRRIGFVAELLSRNGIIVVVAAISPYRSTRDEVKSKIANFIEVFVDCPVEVLAQRDVKGLYKKALAGEVGNFTGISDPYEPPLKPDVTVRSDRETLEESVGKVWSELARRGWGSGGMIDLHSHTDQSDGTFTAAELVAEAMRIGLKALAITDHDTMGGYDQAVPFAAAAGLRLICGIELSTKYQGVSVHLLGYFPAKLPPADFREWLAFLLESRRDRNRRLIEKLNSLGVPITLEEVEAYGKTLTARPHFARVLIDKGYAKDMQDAFDQFLDEKGRGYVQRHDIPIQEAIDRIRNAGGVCSLAHPVRVAKNQWDVLERYIGELAPMGLQAVEVYHSDHSPENVSFYKRLAERFGLGVTGGSDFHGGNKPTISLGTGCRKNLNVPDELADRLTGLIVR